MTTSAERHRSRTRHAHWALLTATAIALALGAANGAWATDIYVDITHTGTELGTLQEPYNTIQEGVTAASDGDTVIVAAGTYRELVVIDDRDIILTAATTDSPSSYVIDADTDSDGTGNGIAVQYGGIITDGEVAGFTIRNGEGGGITGGSSHNNKGYYEAPVDIRYCVIQDNNTDGRGGGIAYITGTVEYCTFTGNTALVGAAASNNEHMEGTFANNLVYSNAASFQTNYGCGGAQGFKYVLNNVFHDNSGYWGAAVDACEVVRNNVIYGNTSEKGAVSGVGVLESNTIYGNATNTAQSGKAGVYLGYYFDDPIVRNNIIWGNVQGTTTTNQQIFVDDPWNDHVITVHNCCIQHGWTGDGVDDDASGITSVDPQLADPDDATAPDFHLTYDSTSCIDAGADLSDATDDTAIDEDFEGDFRPLGDGYDIGADEQSTFVRTWDDDYTGWIRTAQGSFQVTHDGDYDYYMRNQLAANGYSNFYHAFDSADVKATFSYCVESFSGASSYSRIVLRTGNDGWLSVRLWSNRMDVYKHSYPTAVYTDYDFGSTVDQWYDIEAICESDRVIVRRRLSGATEWTTAFDLSDLTTMASDTGSVWLHSYGTVLKIDDLALEGTKQPGGGGAGGPSGCDDFEDGNVTGWTTTGTWTVTDTGDDDKYVENTSQGAKLSRSTRTDTGTAIPDDFELHFSYRVDDDADWYAQALFVNFRSTTGVGYLRLDIRPGWLFDLYEGVTRLGRNVLAASESGVWYDVKIVCDGTSVTVDLRKQGYAWEEIFDVTTSRTSGDMVEFQMVNDAYYRLDDIAIVPLP